MKQCNQMMKLISHKVSHAHQLCTRFGLSFKRDERGGIALMFALMLPILFGIVGLGMEAGMWFKERRQLQTIADSAAVSAAIENAYGSSQIEIEAAAIQEADQNGFDASTDVITYIGAPTSGAYIGDADYIEVIVSRQLSTVISQVFTNLSPSTTSRAVASTIGDQQACVLALSASAQNSMYVNASGSTVTMAGCSVASNSSDSIKSVNVQNGTLIAECVWAAGGISGEANITTNCPASYPDAKPLSDPYANTTIPLYSNTTPPCLTGNGNTPYTPANAEVLQPGVYCNGITVSSGNTVTMAPGEYIIDEGDFTVTGGGAVSGAGLTVFLTSSSGNQYGTVNISGGGTVDMGAATSGDYIGMLFYQDRAGGASSSNDIIITGGAEIILSGAVYAPNNDIQFSGNTTTDGSGCLMLVAQEVKFGGGADIDNSCDMYGGNPAVFGAQPGLVE